MVVGWAVYYLIYKQTSWPNYAYVVAALVLIFLSIYCAEKVYYRFKIRQTINYFEICPLL